MTLIHDLDLTKWMMYRWTLWRYTNAVNIITIIIIIIVPSVV